MKGHHAHDSWYNPVHWVCFLALAVYLHPFAKYPGPFLAKLTTSRAAYHAWKGDVHLDIWLCHKKFGPIVRYGPNHLIFNTVTALNDIYGRGKNMKKPWMYSKLSHKTRDLLIIVDDKEHAIWRKIVGSGLSPVAFKLCEPRLLQHITELCHILYPKEIIHNKEQDLSSIWGPPMKMFDWFSFLTFDLMTDFTFGKHYNLLSNDKYRSIVDDITTSRLRTAVIVYAPFLYLGRLDKKLFPSSVESARRFLKFAEHIIAEGHILEKSVDGNAFSTLTAYKDEISGTSLRQEEVLAEAIFLMIAGYDTTLTALCAIIFYLSRNPHAYSSLAHEIRTRFGDIKEIKTGQQLNDCAYLRACIDETLRMSPPLASSMMREAGSGGVRVDGEYIPAGYCVGTGIYSIHHNPEYFPRPYEFIPERWLPMIGVKAKEQTKQDLTAFNAFSKGPGACLGISIAYWELSVIMSRIIYTFDFKAADGPSGDLGAGDPFAEPGRTNPIEFQLYDRISCLKNGPSIQFRPRTRDV